MRSRQRREGEEDDRRDGLRQTTPITPCDKPLEPRDSERHGRYIRHRRSRHRER